MTGEEALSLAKKFTRDTALGQGAVQVPGPPGRNAELRNNGTHIQWRVAGESVWNNLVALSELAGVNIATPPENRAAILQSVDGVLQWVTVPTLLAVNEENNVP